MKLADLATGSDWIVWIVFVIFAVLSIILLSGHGSWFIWACLKIFCLHFLYILHWGLFWLMSW